MHNICCLFSYVAVLFCCCCRLTGTKVCVCIFVFVCILYVMERIVCLITTPPTYFLAKDILVAATVRDRILILV